MSDTFLIFLLESHRFFLKLKNYFDISPYKRKKNYFIMNNFFDLTILQPKKIFKFGECFFFVFLTVVFSMVFMTHLFVTLVGALKLQITICSGYKNHRTLNYFQRFCSFFSKKNFFSI